MSTIEKESAESDADYYGKRKETDEWILSMCQEIMHRHGMVGRDLDLRDLDPAGRR
jgi:hypothetical protein